MQLTLQVRAHGNAPASNEQRKSFSQFPVVIGRSSACHYCLADESRYISSRHATLNVRDGQLYIEDTSSNGVFIDDNNAAVGRGKSALLKGGEVLLIGDYQLMVEFSSPASSAPTPVSSNPFDDDPTPVSPLEKMDSDPFNSDEHDWTPPSEQREPISDPFDDVWNESDKAQPPAAPKVEEKSDPEWPLDWDESKVNAPAINPARDPHQAAASTSSDWPADDFDWATESTPAADAVTQHNDAQSPHPNSLETEHANQVRADHHARQSGSALAADIRHQPPREPPREPPRAPVSSSPRESGQPSGAANPVYGNVSTKQLLVAAGLNPDDPAFHDEAALVTQSGRVLSQSIEAMMLLLRSRSEMKNAIRSDVTMLSRHDNNPLKFSLTSSDALTRLLTADSDGFMDADAAIQEAVNDLKLHQLAMLDGMKAAVKALLKQFDPQKLAKKMEKNGGIGANIPITREAKLWELFCEQYDTISEEAVTDFDDLFGAEFRKAYEKRTGKINGDQDFEF